MLEWRGVQGGPFSRGVAFSPLPSTCFYTCRNANAGPHAVKRSSAGRNLLEFRCALTCYCVL